MSLISTYSNKTFVPTIDIDIVWHAHQCETKEYINFCKHLAHKLIDHDDTIESDDLAKGYARTWMYWSRSYKETYSYKSAKYKDWQKGHECLSIICPPYLLYRRNQWRKYNNPPVNHVKAPTSNNKFAILGTPVMEGRPQKDKTNDSVLELSLYVALNDMSKNSDSDNYIPIGCGGGCAVSSNGHGCGGHGCGSHGCGCHGCGGHGCGGGCGGGGCGGS